ncbi:MAG: hypothetical protein GXO45_01095 [Aquificae bacterium]|nr:hypothetical protein [Aquificota bacterium]
MVENVSVPQTLIEEGVSFINKWSEKPLETKKDLLSLRKEIKKFIKTKVLDEYKLSKWEIRGFVQQVFEKAQIKMEEDSPKKVVFLTFTDLLAETKDSSPLLLFYEGAPLVEKHSIIVEFNLLPFLLNTAEELDNYKRHQLVLQLFPQDELLSEGVSLKLSHLNFLLLNLLNKILHKQIIPIEKILINNNGNLTVEKNLITFLLVSTFASVYEVITGEKQDYKQKTKELSVLFAKIKNYIKKVFSDEREVEYLLFVSKLEETSIENRSLLTRSYETQKNVFEEAILKTGLDEVEKIEPIFWLLGLNNINPVLLVRYFDTDSVVYYLFDMFKQAYDEGYLTPQLVETGKKFLKRFFKMPYLSKRQINQKVLDEPMDTLYKDDKSLMADYYYFTQRYDKFLSSLDGAELDNETKLKQLFGKYFTNQINKDELIGWLSLVKTSEGEFFYHLLTDTLQQLPDTNQYKHIAKAYTTGDKSEALSTIGEEGFYTQLAKLTGIYPQDQKLKGLLEVRY